MESNSCKETPGNKYKAIGERVSTWGDLHGWAALENCYVRMSDEDQADLQRQVLEAEGAPAEHPTPAQFAE